MARPPKSAEAHKLEGTYRADRHQNTGVKFNPASSIDLPEEITDPKTIDVWNSIIPALCEKGLVSIVEVPILEYAFSCFQNAQYCKASIDKAGGVCAYLITLDYKQKDLTKYYKDYMVEFNNIMFKFGVTPVENPKVRSAPKGKADDDISDLLAMRGRG